MSDPRESAVEGVLTSVRWQHRSDGRVALVLILDDGVRMATGNCPPEMQAEAHQLLNARVIVQERDGEIVGVSRATQPPAVETDAAYRERLFANGLAAHAHDALLTRLHTSYGAALDKAGLALGLCRLPAPKEPPPMATYPRLRFRSALDGRGVLTEGRIADVGGSVADVLLADGRVLELDVGGSAEAREALIAMARASVRLCVQVEGATIHSLEPSDLAQQTRGASGVPIELAVLGAVSRAPVLTDEPLTLEVPDTAKGRGRGTVVGQLAASGPTGVLLSVLGTDRQQGLSVEWTDEARAWAQAAKGSTVCVHHVGGWAYSIEVVKAVPAAAPASLAIGGERVVLEPDDPTARDQLAALAERPGLLESTDDPRETLAKVGKHLADAGFSYASVQLPTPKETAPMSTEETYASIRFTRSRQSHPVSAREGTIVGVNGTRVSFKGDNERTWETFEIGDSAEVSAELIRMTASGVRVRIVVDDAVQLAFVEPADPKLVARANADNVRPKTIVSHLPVPEHVKEWDANAPARTADKPTLASRASAVVAAARPEVEAAAWRTAGSQFVRLAREPLLALLTRHLGPDDPAMRGRLAAALDTEIGAALFAGVLSLGLAAMPSPHAQRLASELRVKGLAEMGDLLASLLTGPLLAVVSLYLQDPGGMVGPTPPAELGEGLHGRLGEVRAAVREASGG